MKHMLMQFAEMPDLQPVNTDQIVYDPTLNLNVLKGTKAAAISFAGLTNLDTSTHTKVHNEISDSDLNRKNSMPDVQFFLDTRTLTYQGDSDK